MKKVLVLNGPNLNMLGIREPEHYGTETLADINNMCVIKGNKLGFEVECKQSNHEGELVTWIQEAYGDCDGIIINPAAYTHTSVALLDALKAVQPMPVIEVHLSKVSERDDFRQISYVSKVANEIISGHKSKGYLMAMDKMIELLNYPKLQILGDEKPASENTPA